MPKSRLMNSTINMVYSFGVKLASFLSGFVLRTVFIRVLGMEYAGVSGLFTDVLMVLSFAELGISTAMTYALYKPIAEQDKDKIQKLMHFYKWAYRFVAGSVLGLGLVFVPFIHLIITDVPDITESITLIYILYLLNTSVSYLLVYKSTMLTASQKNYEISKITIKISIIRCLIGCALLIGFKNFIVYLLMEIGVAVVQNILIGKKAEKLFPEMKEIPKEPLEKKEVKSLFKDIKALFLYKISGVVLGGTDSIIISTFVGTGVVGILANYNLIVKNIYTLILQIFTSMSASIGNLAVTSSKEKQYQVFKATLLMSFWLFGFCTVELYAGLNLFMEVWMGAGYIFSKGIMLILIIDFYLTGMMSPVSSFRTSNGLFVQGQYRPLIMAVINIVVSIGLVKCMGVAGVLLGTVFSRIVTQIWYDPYLIYKHVFGKSVFLYAKKMALYIGIIIGCSGICHYIGNQIEYTNTLIELGVKIMLNAVVFNGMCLVFFSRSEEFVYLKKSIDKIVSAVKGRK